MLVLPFFRKIFWFFKVCIFCTVFFLLQLLFAWENRSPASYQMFVNRNYGNKMTKFTCLLTWCIKTCHELVESRKTTLRTLFPSGRAGHCTLMLTMNIAEPEWINVGCSSQLLQDVWCAVPQNSSQIKLVQNISGSFCLFQQILISDICLVFSNNMSFIYTLESSLKTLAKKNLNVQFLIVLMKAISTNLPLLCISPPQDLKILCLTCERIWNHFAPKYIRGPMEHFGGLHIYTTRKTTADIGINLFLCAGGSYISSKHLCDGVVNCQMNDNSDEAMELCDDMEFQRNEQKDHNIQMYTSQKQDIFKCNSSEEILMPLLNDLVSDCGDNKDEPILLKNLVEGFYVHWSDPSQIPCRTGHPRCFNIEQICIFHLDNFDNLEPCRNGGHLGECADF